uniref:Outer capsid glycoprotein VP7 n=1 Tax=Porcine rotavirus C TaxID=10968 RepID=A0A0C5B1K2_9REOV|nr:outer capsid protein [Porcine rotavirus C]
MVCTTLCTVCVILSILLVYILIFRKMFHLIIDTAVITLIVSSCIRYSDAQLFTNDIYYDGNIETVVNGTNPFGIDSLCIYFPASAVGSPGQGKADGLLNDNNYASILAALFETKGFPKGSVNFITYARPVDFITSIDMTCSYNIVLIHDNLANSETTEQIVEWILNVWRCDEVNLDIYTYEQVGNDNIWAAFGNDCDISVCPLDTSANGIGCIPASLDTYEVISNNTEVALLNVVDNVRHRIQMNQAACRIKNCIKGEERLNTAIVRISNSSSFDNSLSPLNNGQNTRSFKINAMKWWKIFYTIVDYVNIFIQSMAPRHRAIYPEGWMLRYA